MDKPERKRRGPLTWLAGRSRRFWITVAMMPVLYVASVGPACWLTAVPIEQVLQSGLPDVEWMRIYTPIGKAAWSSVGYDVIEWWARFGLTEDEVAVLPMSFRGGAIAFYGSE